MQGWLQIDTDDVRTEPQLAKWVNLGTTHARSLPPKRWVQESRVMSKVIAGITVSVDGYVTGPHRPGCGLGVGGERLHYWVFEGPWTYE